MTRGQRSEAGIRTSNTRDVRRNDDLHILGCERSSVGREKDEGGRRGGRGWGKMGCHIISLYIVPFDIYESHHDFVE
jgi:hypothetical protein